MFVSNQTFAPDYVFCCFVWWSCWKSHWADMSGSLTLSVLMMVFWNLTQFILNTNCIICCVLSAGIFIPKKSPSNVRSAERASVSPGLWLSTKHYTCRSRNWSQPRSSDSVWQQGRDRDTGKTRPKTTTVKEQPKTFSSQLLEVESSASMGILFSRMKYFTSQFLKK